MIECPGLQTPARDEERRAKLFGHAMLIVFPLGLFATALLFDLVRLFHGGGAWGEAAFFVERLGVGVDEGAGLDAPSSLSASAGGRRAVE